MKIISVYVEDTSMGVPFTQITVYDGLDDQTVELALVGDHEDELVGIINDWFVSKQAEE